jgi:glycosyltransferase involved in cell wall biosynthesis
VTYVLKALSCVVSVVSTECPSGPAEILEHGHFGDLVPVGDEEAQAFAIDEALVNPRPRILPQNRATHFAPAIATTSYLALLTGPL